MPITGTRQVEWAGLLLDLPYEVQSVDGLLSLPELRVADYARVGRDGFVAGRDWLSGRTVTIAVDITDDDAAVFDDAVAGLLAVCPPTGAERQLKFRIPGVAGGATALINARARRGPAITVDTLYHQNAARAVIEFFATDPLIYSDLETTLSLTAEIPPAGRTYPKTYDYNYGPPGSPGIGTATNQGNYPAPVQVRINGPITGPRVINETTDMELALNITLAAGEWIDLDTRTRTVLLQGTANRYHLLTSAEWWDLQPGNNAIRFTGSESTGSTAQITYRSSWL